MSYRVFCYVLSHVVDSNHKLHLWLSSTLAIASIQESQPILHDTYVREITTLNFLVQGVSP